MSGRWAPYNVCGRMGIVMEFKKLIFVTKFEELCFDALRSLLNLRQAALNHVVFLNVIEREKVAKYRGTGIIKDEEIRLRERANIRFIDWAETLFEQGMEVGVYISVGRVVPESIKAAEKEQADLIVIGRSHKGVLEYLYSGSDVIEIVRRARVPVMILKHSENETHHFDEPFTRPLLAMDWSSASLRAVGYLKNLHAVLEKIDLVHVVPEKDLKGTSSMDIQKTRKEIRKRLDEICDDFASSGISARSHVFIGEAETELERAARECRSSLIVLGSSTRSAWLERWIGSTPRRIAEKSPYPTLLIPPATA